MKEIGVKLQQENDFLYIEYAIHFSEAITKISDYDITSVVVFGDVLDGKKVKYIDIFIVSDKPFNHETIKGIENGLKTTREYKELKKRKLGTQFRVVTFTPSEVEKNPPILSQVTKEGLPLLDTDDFMSNRMEDYETINI
ncbi:MAG: hypothetical protein V1854_01475 [Methanobacteriota archaeon]